MTSARSPSPSSTFAASAPHRPASSCRLRSGAARSGADRGVRSGVGLLLKVLRLFLVVACCQLGGVWELFCAQADPCAENASDCMDCPMEASGHDCPPDCFPCHHHASAASVPQAERSGWPVPAHGTTLLRVLVPRAGPRPAFASSIYRPPRPASARV
jgi:hypothetical protein